MKNEYEGIENLYDVIWKFVICFNRLLFILSMMKINNFINNKLILLMDKV